MTFFHPRHARLSRYADGDLPVSRRARIATHLADCPHCRSRLRFIRHAGELARSLEAPRVSPAVLDDAIARRWAGERVLLSSEPPGARPSAPRRILSPIAAALTLLATAVLVVGVIVGQDAAVGGTTPDPSPAVAPPPAAAGGPSGTETAPGSGSVGPEAAPVRRSVRPASPGS